MRPNRISPYAGIYVLAAGLLPGQPASCDPELLQPAATPYGYRQRGERCEGIYVQQVSGPSLVIASWTESFADYDLASGQPLILEWERAGGTAAVRLRAQGLRRRLYYRMDALSPPRARSFTWPSEILSALQIPRTDIGVTATTRDSVAGAERDLFLPLRVHQGATAPQPSGYRLVLLPGVELKEVFLTLTAASGDRRTVLKDGEPMGYGYYPAERPIEVPVAGPPAPGVYHLEIGATLKNGGAATVEFWFYHHGSQERRK